MILGMIKSRLNTFDPVNTSFFGRTVLITGSNVGLGLEEAHLAASLDPDCLILAVRNLEKGKAAAAEIEARVAKPGLCKVMELDMANFDSVASFAKSLDQEAPFVDIAILNAGISNMHYQQSVHGWEMDLQVNALSTTLLALLLMPQLKRTAEHRSLEHKTPTPSHLTIVTSSAHQQVRKGQLPPNNASVLEGISGPKNGDGFGSFYQYAKSKLVIMWMISRLAQMGAGDDPATPSVIVDAVCPGVCRSTLSRGADSVMLKALVIILSFLFAKPTEVGGRIIVKAGTLGPEAVGGYWYENELSQ